MRFPLLVLSLVLAPCLLVRARDEVSTRALGRLKQATALVKASTVRGEQRGAGFLVHAKGGVGYVVANAHVVQSGEQPSRRVECVFRSGTADEFVVPASVLSVDRERDMAILQVKRSDLPAAISLESQPGPREGSPVYVLGFPSEASPPSKGRHPAVTVSNGTASVAGRTRPGDSPPLQISGAVNAENSGGPVVDAEGNLLGMAVAAREGQQNASAIAPSELQETLYGRIDKVNVAQAGEARRRIEYKFDVTLVDPMNGIRSVFVHTIPRDKVRGQPPRNRDGSFAPVASSMRAHKLEVSDGRAKGTVYLETRGGQAEPHLYQLRFIRGDNATRYTAPTLLEATEATSSNGEASVADAAPQDEAAPDSRLPPRIPQPSVKLRSAGLTAIDLGPEKKFAKKLPGNVKQLAVGGAGRYFVMHFEDQGEIGIFDVNQGDIVKQFPGPADAVLAASVDKLFIFSPADNAVRRWSLSKLREEKAPTLSVDGTVTGAAIGHSCSGPLLLQVQEDGERVPLNLFVDPVSLKPELRRDVWLKHRRGVAAAPTKPNGAFGIPMMMTGDNVIRASGSGQVFGIWSPSRGNGMTVMIDEETVMCFYDETRYGHLLPMPDGSAVCTARGYVKSDLSVARDRQYLLPSYHPDYYISVPAAGSRQGGKIIDRKTGRPVGDLPAIDHLAGAETGSARQPLLLPDQRIHYLPQARVLITIHSDDELVVQQVDFEPSPISEELAYSSKSETKVAEPRRPAVAEPRMWRDRSGRFELEAVFVSQNNDQVQLRKSNGQTVSIPVDDLSPADVDYVKQLTQQTQPATGKQPTSEREKPTPPKEAPRQRPR